jgi:hypothetical protein
MSGMGNDGCTRRRLSLGSMFRFWILFSLWGRVRQFIDVPMRVCTWTWEGRNTGNLGSDNAKRCIQKVRDRNEDAV